VILHTTQFNAKKGDSFYIPPKNYYNLINQKAREAELSLIQFQVRTLVILIIVIFVIIIFCHYLRQYVLHYLFHHHHY